MHIELQSSLSVMDYIVSCFDAICQKRDLALVLRVYMLDDVTAHQINRTYAVVLRTHKKG